MIQRIQWMCPVCKRRYAIPATAPTPTLCPQCRRAEAESTDPSPVVSFPAPRPVVERPLQLELEDEGGSAMSALAAIQLEVAEEAARGPTSAVPVVGTARPDLDRLQIISQIYALLAGLAVVGGLGALFYGLRAALVMDATSARTTAIFQAIAAFVGGLVAGFLFFSFREVIRVLIGIEENTRER
jgi:hypothetical protein